MEIDPVKDMLAQLIISGGGILATIAILRVEVENIKKQIEKIEARLWSLTKGEKNGN